MLSFRSFQLGCAATSLLAVSLPVYECWASELGSYAVLSDTRAGWLMAANNGVANQQAIQLAPPLSLRYSSGTPVRVGRDWRNWSGYTGSVIWTGSGPHSIRIITASLFAFGVEVQPESHRTEKFTVSLSNGESISRNVDGSGDPQFFGYIGPGIKWVDVTDESDRPFAFGNFMARSQPSNMLMPVYQAARGDDVPPPVGKPCETTVTGGDQYATLSNDAADLISNEFDVDISGSFGSGYDTGLEVTINGVSNNPYALYDDGAAVGAGSYNVPFTRTQVPPDTYSYTSAYWSDPAFVSTCTMPSPWYVVGTARHSVYNTPAETSCIASDPGTSNAWIATYTAGAHNVCDSATYTATTLNTTFMQQTTENGSGIPASGGPVLKPLLATSGKNCGTAFPPPPGAIISSNANTNNVFTAVASVTGACNFQLSDTNVAARPVTNHLLKSDTLTPVAACKDNILGVNSSETNVFSETKLIADVCPACTDPIQSGGPPLYTHFDNYTTDIACFPHNNSDLAGSPFWTADVVGETK